MKSTLDDIRIRDPFFVTLPESRSYLLVAANAAERGVDFWRSSDLVHFEGPFPLFRLKDGSSYDSATQFWAPEIHPYGGKWYLFLTLGNKERLMHGTWIFRADTPEGPYERFSNAPATPANWMCLDGTLHVDAQGNPHLVFCHEWLQCSDGEICAVPLKRDLSGAAGRPVLLFCGSEAAWIPKRPWDAETECAPSGYPRYVTDGPFLWRGKDGKLLMLWSTFSGKDYTMGIAESDGGLYGNWTQRKEPLFHKDGGHGMLFRDLDGRLLMTLHQPNSVCERAKLFPLEEL